MSSFFHLEWSVSEMPNDVCWLFNHSKLCKKIILYKIETFALVILNDSTQLFSSNFDVCSISFLFVSSSFQVYCTTCIKIKKNYLIVVITTLTNNQRTSKKTLELNNWWRVNSRDKDFSPSTKLYWDEKKNYNFLCFDLKCTWAWDSLCDFGVESESWLHCS